jgi:magnesium transporter
MQRRYNVVDRKLVETQEAESLLTVYINPDEQERKYLVETLRIDEHTLHSALDPDELSRLEFEPEHVALIYKRPTVYSHDEQFLFQVASTGAFLFKDKLIMVIGEEVPLSDSSQVIRFATPGYLLLKLINRSTVHFLAHLKVIAAISDSLQEKINTAMENRSLIDLFTLEKSLIYYLNSLNSNSMVLEKTKANAVRMGFSSEESEVLDDMIIDCGQCYKQAEIYSNILAGLMDARASIVNNNLNQLIKYLNILTIAIMVPTFVVSAFSMNVHIPLEDHPLAFYIVMGFAVVSVLGFLWLWHRKKW